MDRVTVYPGAIPLETDLLSTNKNTMIALSKLASAMLGTGTIASGFAVTPTGPASLQVVAAPGEIYSLQNVDGTAYSSIAADTAHQIVKQGIQLDPATLNCPAPTTSGQSINYLVEVAYQDLDANPVVLPYYNASNPSQAYSGPGNNGVAQNTSRKGVVLIQAKAGASATTGSQVTPAPDAGYIGLYVVTVAFGQTTITSGNIVALTTAPLINSTLHGLAPVFTVPPVVPVATLPAHAMQLGQATGRLLNVQVFSTAGTFTYTPTPGTTSVVVEVQGGGGGSGGLAATGGTTGAASGGGSAGACAQARLTTGISGATVTVGAKGAGGAAGANNGSAGGSSSFGALVTAPGGPGGQGGAAAAPPAVGISGAASAAPTGGNIYQNIGAAASSSLLAGLSAPIFGPGASTKFGCGQRGNSSSATVNAVGFGVGGGGCVNGISTAAQIGADGAGGIVIVWEYA